MNKNRRFTITGIILLFLGAPIGYLLSELTKQKIAHLQELGLTTNADILRLQALLAMDIGSFLSLVGLVIVTIKLARYIRNKMIS